MCGCCEVQKVSHADESVEPNIKSYEYRIYPPDINSSSDNTKSIDISFLGDCLIGTYNGFKPSGSIGDVLDNKPISYCFEGCINDIKDDDFTIANCESVLSDKPLIPVKKGYTPAYWYRADTKSAKLFSNNSIEAVTIANNHTYDYGNQGYEDTKMALDAEKIPWTDSSKPLYLEKEGIRIAVLSVMFGDGATMGTTIKQISEAREVHNAKAVIVFVHSGTERIHTPEEWKVKQFRKLIDSGADLVVGAHPHVLQPFENYKGSHIVYSIGNFVFGDGTYFENATVIFKESFVFDMNGNLIKQRETILPYNVYSDTKNNFRPAPIKGPKLCMDVLDFMYGRKEEEVLQNIK